MAQWIRPWTLNQEVPVSNPHAMAVVTLDKAPHSHCLLLWKELKVFSPLVAYMPCFLSGPVKLIQIQSNQ